MDYGEGTSHRSHLSNTWLLPAPVWDATLAQPLVAIKAIVSRFNRVFFGFSAAIGTALFRRLTGLSNLPAHKKQGGPRSRPALCIDNRLIRGVVLVGEAVKAPTGCRDLKATVPVD